MFIGETLYDFSQKCTEFQCVNVANDMCADGMICICDELFGQQTAAPRTCCFHWRVMRLFACEAVEQLYAVVYN